MDEPRARLLVTENSCLLVEDDPVLRRVLRGHLVRRGLRVSVAANVAEARAALDGQRFSYLITDAILPDGSGFDLFPNLQGVADSPTIVMISGDESVGQTVRELACPRTSFLLKPFGMPRLDALLAIDHGPAR
jgi:DNA-binding NtrC family response regulator